MYQFPGFVQWLVIQNVADDVEYHLVGFPGISFGTDHVGLCSKICR